MKKIKQILDKLEQCKSEIMFSLLARQKFQTECEKIYQEIINEVGKLALLVIKKNTENRLFYTFEIHNIGSVSISIFESDCLTPVVDRLFTTNLSIKKDSYTRDSDNYDEYSLVSFKEAIKLLEEYNRILKEH